MKIGLKENLSTTLAMLASQFIYADLSIFHEFEPPPNGGGHQFLHAFVKQAGQRGIRVENNRISRTTRSCLFNSFNFDEKRLSYMKHDSVLFVHRVDGPIDTYRGKNDGVDIHIQNMNQKIATKTIFQSEYSLNKHIELGLKFQNPIVIPNATDPEIFNSQHRNVFSRERKIRLIASSWSNNINKGADVYQWLDENLDWKRFEFTFVGRSPIEFKHIRMLPPVDSSRMAELFREHDIYLTASRNDPCSNSLIEALACGLPAVYLRSGGHPEIVKHAGIGFEAREQIPELLNQMVDSYEYFQSHIHLLSMEEVSLKYFEVLELI